MTPKSVLQVLPALNDGGVEIETLLVAQGIAAAGWKSYVTSAGGRLATRLTAQGLSHITLPFDTKNPFKIILNAWRLAQLVKALQIEIVHMRSRSCGWSAWLGRYIARYHLVSTYHGDYKSQNGFKRWYNSIMVRAERVVAISPYIAHRIEAQYPWATNQIVTINRGIDLQHYSPEKVTKARQNALRHAWGIKDNKPILLLPARVRPIKGHEIVLQALPHLKEKHLYCIFLGPYEEGSAFYQQLQQIINAHHLHDKVRFVGPCQDMPAAYQIADIVLAPSIHPEAFGRTIAEAQAMQKVVISTNIGAPKDLITSGENGWLVPPKDATALAATINMVLHLTPRKRQKITQAAQKRVAHHYRLETMIDATLKLYQEVIRAPTA